MIENEVKNWLTNEMSLDVNDIEHKLLQLSSNDKNLICEFMLPLHQTMVNFDRKKAFSNILTIASIISFALSFILVPIFKHLGSALTVTITESFVTIAMFIYLQKNGLKIIGENKNV